MIANNISDILFCIQPRTNLVTMCNHYLISELGYEFTEVINNPFIKFVHKESVSDVKKAIKSLKKTAQYNNRRFILKDKQGKKAYICLKLTAKKKDDGQFMQFIGVARLNKHCQHYENMTTKKISILQRLSTLGSLLVGITHEISTPMQFISDNIYVVKKQIDAMTTSIEYKQNLPSLVNMQEAIVDAQEGLMYITNLISVMKNFSHFKEIESREPTDINAIIENTLVITKNEWKYCSQIQKQLNPNLPMVIAHPNDIKQILLNLVINACHAIKESVETTHQKDGLITLITEQINDKIQIIIKDNGIGIPKEIQPKVFEPFFTTKSIGIGTGQGLSLVKNLIVDKYGGRIEFESTINEGSTFIIELPLAAVVSSSV